MDSPHKCFHIPKNIKQHLYIFQKCAYRTNPSDRKAKDCIFLILQLILFQKVNPAEMLEMQVYYIPLPQTCILSVH